MSSHGAMFFFQLINCQRISFKLQRLLASFHLSQKKCTKASMRGILRNTCHRFVPFHYLHDATYFLLVSNINCGPVPSLIQALREAAHHYRDNGLHTMKCNSDYAIMGKQLSQKYPKLGQGQKRPWATFTRLLSGRLRSYRFLNR